MHFLRVLQVLLERGEGLFHKCTQILVLSGLHLLLEELDGLFVILNHLLHIGLVELGVGKLLQLVVLPLGIIGQVLWQLDPLLFRDRYQLLVRLLVIPDHALPELRHLRVLGLLLRQLAERYLCQAAGGRFFRKLHILGGEVGVAGLRPVERWI